MTNLNPSAIEVVAELNEGLSEPIATVNPLAIGLDYGAVPLGSIAPHPVEHMGWIARIEGGWSEGMETIVEAQALTR